MLSGEKGSLCRTEHVVRSAKSHSLREEGISFLQGAVHHTARRHFGRAVLQPLSAGDAVYGFHRLVGRPKPQGEGM